MTAPVLLANGGTAFLLNIAVFLLIGKTSALTMNIAGVIKDWMLIMFSYYGFHAPVTQASVRPPQANGCNWLTVSASDPTQLNLLGYVFSCAGVFVYNYHKLQQLQAGAKKGPS